MWGDGRGPRERELNTKCAFVKWLKNKIDLNNFKRYTRFHYKSYYNGLELILLSMLISNLESSSVSLSGSGILSMCQGVWQENSHLELWDIICVHGPCLSQGQMGQGESSRVKMLLEHRSSLQLADSYFTAAPERTKNIREK